MDFGKLLSIPFFKDTPLSAKVFILFILVFFSCFMIAIIVLKDDLRELIKDPVNVPIKKLSEKEQDIKIINEKVFKVKWDSVLKSQANLKMQKSIENKSSIGAECRIIQERLNYCNYVTYWKVHNNREPIDVNKDALSIVLLSSSEDIMYDYRKSQKLPNGYFYLAKQTIENDMMTYTNVMNMAPIAYGKTRVLMNQLDTKAIMMATVSQSFTEWYFVTFSFSKTSPDDYNTDLRLELSDFRRFVQKRQDEGINDLGEKLKGEW